MWWIVDVGFSHALDEKNAIKAQKKCISIAKLLTFSINRVRKGHIYDPPYLGGNELKIACHLIFPPCKVCAIKNIWTII